MADEITIVVRAKDEFSTVLGNFGNIVTGIKSAIDLLSSGFQTFVGFASQGIEAIASYERMNITLQTLAASQEVMTGSAKDMNEALRMTAGTGEELLKWVQELAIHSPFTQEGVADAFRMAMAYGFNVDESKRLTEAMIDFVAGTGQTEYAMQRISLALGQISATGKLTGQDMLQLTQVGVPVLQILADHFGVTTAEVIKMRTDGLIPAKEAIEAITSWMETNFGGAANKFTQSWAGLLGTFSDLKQMGMREFFQGMADALQPLAIEFSNWLQTEGMDKLKEWGQYLGVFTQALVDLVMGNKLYDLGAMLQDLGDKGSFIENLGTSIRVFQQALDNGLPVMEAFKIGIDKLFGFDPTINESLLQTIDQLVANFFNAINNKIVLWNASDGPENLSKEIIKFLDSLGQGTEFDSKAVEAVKRIFASIIGSLSVVPVDDLGKAVDSALARGINNTDWRAAGDAFTDNFSKFIEALFSGASTSEENKVQWWAYIMPGVGSFYAFTQTETAKAIGDAIKNFFKGMFDDLGTSIYEWLTSPTFDWAGALGQWGQNFKQAAISFNFGQYFTDIGQQLASGLYYGLRVMWFDFKTWAIEHIIDPVKQALGIASPSTIFMQIGINIIQGLILGFQSISTLLYAVIRNTVDNLLGYFKGLLSNILDIFNEIIQAYNKSGVAGVIDYIMGGLTGSTTTGTTGSRTPTSPDTRTGTSSASTVAYNFYGTVYFSGATGEGSYDCPVPNPIIKSSSGVLTTDGVA